MIRLSSKGVSEIIKVEGGFTRYMEQLFLTSSYLGSWELGENIIGSCVGRVRRKNHIVHLLSLLYMRPKRIYRENLDDNL